MFLPKPNVTYKFCFQEIKCCLPMETFMMLTFTEENQLFRSEIDYNFDQYECCDNHGDRFLCYVEGNHYKYCFLKSDEDANGEVKCFYPIKVYLDNEIIFVNSLPNSYNEPKKLD